jgi:hypothetical protein
MAGFGFHLRIFIMNLIVLHGLMMKRILAGIHTLVNTSELIRMDIVTGLMMDIGMVTA